MWDFYPTNDEMTQYQALPSTARSHPGFRLYGQNHITCLAEHFIPESDSEEVAAEWGKFKYELLTLKADIKESQQSNSTEDMESNQITPTTWSLQRLMQAESFYPQLSQIADILLSLPVSNAWPERGASAIKRLKTRLRSSLKNDMLQALMHISINGADISSKQGKGMIKAAVSKWLKKKNRRKLPRKVPQKRPEAHVIDAAVQTEPCNLTQEEFAQLVRDEVQVYAKAVHLPPESPPTSDDEWSDSDF